MMGEDDVTRIVHETIKQQLAPCAVDLHLRRSVDEDGDAVLNIMVIIKTECAPDKHKMLGLTRHLRSNLTEAASAGFPVLSFVSKRDAAKLDLETV